MVLQRMGVPIYLQVKNHILEKIRSGFYQPGSKLPTERDLATELGISRNTVSAAYKELLLEGALEARQGRGTFVKGANTGEETGGRRERLLRIIDDAMGKVVELGFSVEQFAAFVTIRAKEKAEAVRELRVAVVDVTHEYIQRYISQIGQMAHLRFEPLLLSELGAEQSAELLKVCQLVVTPLEHQAAVAAITDNPAKVVPVATMACLEAVVKIARLPAETRVAVVADHREFMDSLTAFLTKMGLQQIKMEFVPSEGRAALRDSLAPYQVIVASEAGERLVGPLVTANQNIIVFYYEIDRGSLNQLLTRLLNFTV
ncbi:GntR family transcriptional regulator [Azotosporobacter soli]|uniref:GntR family transcriptional regulator n=1 Tax=Azotosporobacter soli TaxID=3055040 RepID=UPI0031FF0BFC